MRTSINMVKRIISFIENRIYVNNTTILYKHVNAIIQHSPAKIVQADYDNLKDILVFQHPRYIKIFTNFLDNGDRGYFAYLNGKCVHRSWVQFGRKEVLLNPFIKKVINHNEAYIHYCETAPEARGNNIYPSVLSKIASDIKDKYPTIFISTNIKNIASRRGIEKAGFHEIERIKTIIFLGIKYKKTLKDSTSI